MNRIKSFIIFCTFFFGMISILFKWRDLDNTQDIYWLLGFSTLFGVIFSSLICRKTFFLFSSVPDNEFWAAKSLFYAGAISLSISILCTLNINYAKSNDVYSYEITDKKYREKAGKAPESWHISINRQGITV